MPHNICGRKLTRRGQPLTFAFCCGGLTGWPDCNLPRAASARIIRTVSIPANSSGVLAEFTAGSGVVFPQKNAAKRRLDYMGHFRIILPAALVALSAGVAVRQALAADPAPRFNRDIRPILADRCYACHGPDSGTREADLRLDTEKGSHESAIVTGDPDSSELVRRISSDDVEERMPPPAAKKPPLTKEEID